MNTTTAVICYSGGLDTSCAIGWLQDDYGFDTVVAVMVDVGQQFDVEASMQRARAAGAADVILLDRRAEFAEVYAARAIVTNALYEGRYPLVSALSRPLIAGAVAEIAAELQADAVVHGCTGKGNDQLRFELAFLANYPGVRVIAPLRDQPRSREEEIDYAVARGIPITHTAESPYSIDENLFGRAIEAGVIEDPWARVPHAAYQLTRDPAHAPPAEEVVLTFECGLPVAIDGEPMELANLIPILNERAGAHGIGRIDMIENRVVGIKSREVYEAPAAMVLIEAHRALEDMVLTRDELRTKHELETRWTQLVYDGLWFSPLKVAIDAFVDTTQEHVSGEVRVQLGSGSVTVTGRRSPNSLYQHALASYGADDAFPHDAAAGFIAISALETTLAAARAAGLSEVMA